MTYSKKEIRTFIKFLKSQVLSIEDLGKSKHYQLQITTRNKDGEIIQLPRFCIASTPSCGNWERQKLADINRIFRKYNILEIRR